MNSERLCRLIERCEPKARRVAGKLLRRGDDVEDALQKARIKAWGARHRAPPRPGKEEAWFMTTVFRSAIEVQRSNQRYTPAFPAEAEAVIDSAPGPLDVALASEELELYALAFMTLCPSRQAVLRASLVATESTAVRAELCGVTVPGFKNAYYRARRQVEELIYSAQ